MQKSSKHLVQGLRCHPEFPELAAKALKALAAAALLIVLVALILTFVFRKMKLL